MTLNIQKIIEVLDPQAGTLRETVVANRPVTALFEVRRGEKRLSLREAATLADFPVLLRDGIRSIAFDAYASAATTWQEWADQISSDKPAEDWVEENSLGELPVVHEEGPYPEAVLNLDRTFQIKNYKRGMLIAVTEEMIRFNRLNILKRHTARLGGAAARTRDVACYSVLTTAGNYTRNSTTGDNDIGANTAATTFPASGLVTALATLRTMKDNKSGSYFDVMPDTLLVTPLLEVGARQLVMSPNLQIPGDGVTTAKVYGTGTVNPLRGMVSRIIVSPRVGTSYQWVLMQAKQAVTLQEVEGLQILQESVGRVEQEGYFRYDKLRYRVRDWYGVGMVNDRFSYLSTSTSAPAVA